MQIRGICTVTWAARNSRPTMVLCATAIGVRARDRARPRLRQGALPPDRGESRAARVRGPRRQLRAASCTASPRPSTTRRCAAMAGQRSNQTHLAVLTSRSAYGELEVGRSLGVMSFDMINGRAGCVAVAARESAGRSLPGLDLWRGTQCDLSTRSQPATTAPPTGGPESARACRSVA